MKILVLKISYWWTKIFMAHQTNFLKILIPSKNFGLFANIVKKDLWCQLDVYIDRFLVLHDLIYPLANLVSYMQ